jgi:hypothetical protein
MRSVEQEFISKIARDKSIKVSSLGLRFDRVVIRLVDDLREFAKLNVPDGTILLVTFTAPLYSPAKTASALKEIIGSILVNNTPLQDINMTVNGIQVRIRINMNSSAISAKLFGFVHNLNSSSTAILDLATERIGDLTDVD